VTYMLTVDTLTALERLPLSTPLARSIAPDAADPENINWLQRFDIQIFETIRIRCPAALTPAGCRPTPPLATTGRRSPSPPSENNSGSWRNTGSDRCSLMIVGGREKMPSDGHVVARWRS
jgi:hypothetical protein